MSKRSFKVDVEFLIESASSYVLPLFSVSILSFWFDFCKEGSELPGEMALPIFFFFPLLLFSKVFPRTITLREDFGDSLSVRSSFGVFSGRPPFFVLSIGLASFLSSFEDFTGWPNFFFTTLVVDLTTTFSFFSPFFDFDGRLFFSGVLIDVIYLLISSASSFDASAGQPLFFEDWLELADSASFAIPFDAFLVVRSVFFATLLLASIFPCDSDIVATNFFLRLVCIIGFASETDNLLRRLSTIGVYSFPFGPTQPIVLCKYSLSASSQVK
mmetsp:Transcript_8160/g.12201  ORF Transcript_8160/g.12201 Transcript_8160/m.12201 type:complete len:271 (-) Transcript_8160:1413-2225(-)